MDPIGKKDSMIIVLSKKQLDYKGMNRSVNQSMTKPYFEKFQMLLQSQISKSSSFGEDGDTIELVSKDHNPDTIDLAKIEFEKSKLKKCNDITLRMNRFKYHITKLYGLP